MSDQDTITNLTNFFESMPCGAAKFLLAAMLASFPDLGNEAARLLGQDQAEAADSMRWLLLNELVETRDGQYYFKSPRLQRRGEAPDNSPQAQIIRAMQQATLFPNLLRSWHNGEVAEQPARTGREGYVYLAYSETGHYKIGKSIDPDKRIKVLGTKAPISIELVHTIECDDAPKAERALHKRFKSKRGEGEWFSLDEAEVSQITSLQKWEDGRFVEGER